MPQTKNIPSWLRRSWEMVFDHPMWILCAMAGVTVIFACAIPRLSFKTTIQDLILEDLPATAEYREFKSVFGSDEMIRVVARCRDIFDPATFAALTHLSRSLGEVDGVSRVLSLPEVKTAVEVSGAWDLEKFKTLIAPVDLFIRNLISADHKATIISLILDPESDKDAVIGEVKKRMDAVPETLTVYQIGMPLVSKALSEYTRRDFLRLPPVTLILICLMLYVLFRNPYGVLVTLSCVVSSLVWTFGAMALLEIPLSMITMIVPVFIIAVGTAYCLYIYTEYTRIGRSLHCAREAVERTFSHVTLPSLLAVATTVIGIGSLCVNPITAIREFSFFAAFGMLSLTVWMFTFYPAILSVTPLVRGASRRGLDSDPLLERLLAGIVAVNLRHQKSAFLVMTSGALLGVLGIFLIRVETNPVAFFRKNTPVSRHFEDIHRDMSGSVPVHVVLKGDTPDYFEDPRHLADLSGFQESLEKLPGVDKSISFADYLKLVNYASNRYEPEFYALAEDDFESRMLINAFRTLLGADLLERFISADHSQVNVLLLTHLSGSTEFLELESAIASHARERLSPEISCRITGLSMVMSASTQKLTIGQVKSLSLSLASIFFVMVLLFKSAKVGFIAIVPNIFPILINFGLMGWLGIPLSMATSLIASIAIGLAVDDTLHYLVRYKSEFKKDLDKDRAMRDTLMAVGKPIIFTSGTLCIGFSILMFSSFQPTALFGALMVVVIIAALAGDLILLPTLLLHTELVTAWDLLRHLPAVGALPPAMVHEINQPLNAIKLGGEFLKMTLKKGGGIDRDQLAAVAREISAQADRASQIIRRLGEFDQRAPLDKEPIDINAPIRGVLSILSNPLRLDDIDLRIELTDPLPPVMGNHNQLTQVLFHLMTNAWESLKTENGSAKAVKPRQVTVRTFLERQRVGVVVSDTGAGIDPHLKDRVFEPFFTTKSPGKGKGLGLCVCRQIVRDHRGEITFESVPGQGASVRITFAPIELSPEGRKASSGSLGKIR